MLGRTLCSLGRRVTLEGQTRWNPIFVTEVHMKYACMLIAFLVVSAAPALAVTPATSDREAALSITYYYLPG